MAALQKGGRSQLLPPLLTPPSPLPPLPPTYNSSGERHRPPTGRIWPPRCRIGPPLCWTGVSAPSRPSPTLGCSLSWRRPLRVGASTRARRMVGFVLVDHGAAARGGLGRARGARVTVATAGAECPGGGGYYRGCYHGVDARTGRHHGRGGRACWGDTVAPSC